MCFNEALWDCGISIGFLCESFGDVFCRMRDRVLLCVGFF